MNITLNIFDTTIHSVAEYISNMIKNRLISSDITVEAFESGIDEKRADVDLILEFNNVPILIENSAIKFLHLSLEANYEGVIWESDTITNPTYSGDGNVVTGLFNNNILWSTAPLDSSGDHNQPIQLLSDEYDCSLSQFIMEKAMDNLTEIEKDIFKRDTWNKYFKI